ncbi:MULTISPECIES: hypothetical protein [Okeania]|uniref:hypothetical protein n=1 Tax=Okeania TaxID=1458928 RepID=UPI00196156AA|nr:MULTISPECIES: hypothetical protein [Okeania]
MFISLMPFVPILKGGGEEAIVREALQLLREDEQLSELENLLEFFATFVLKKRSALSNQQSARLFFNVGEGDFNPYPAAGLQGKPRSAKS